MMIAGQTGRTVFWWYRWPGWASLSWLTLAVLSLSACGNALAPASTAAQATLEAGQVQAQSLAIQSSLVALNLTQAVATENHFLQQTVHAQDATATAREQAFLSSLTETAVAVQAQAVQATQTANTAQTATAWPQTAIPLEATQQAVIAQTESAQRRAQWEQILIPLQVTFFSLLGFVILILLVLGGVGAYRRLLPALEMRLRAFRRGPHDAPLIFLDEWIIDPDRNFGPALHIHNHNAQTVGLAPNPQLQERLVARDQAVDLARTQPIPHYRRSTPAMDMFSSTSSEAVTDVEIEIIEPQQIQPWLDEVERQLLPQASGQKE
jgi:hypothetical protein